MTAPYRGPVMVPNPNVSEGSHHRGQHWMLVPECVDLGCIHRDTEGPDGDSPIAADAVVVVTHLGSNPSPVPAEQEDTDG